MQLGSPYLSTVQAAEALGVSVSTVKRWVDDGILPAHKTVGGHRKLLRSEVLALSRRGELAAANPGLLALGLQDGGETMSAMLAEALEAGRVTEVQGILRTVYDRGMPLDVLADRVIAPALTHIGHGWADGRLDVWREHRGTQLCVAALYDLKDDLEARLERGRPVAVGGAPEGDPYLMASLLAQLVLLDAGWEAVNLGPNTPLPSLARAMRELRPRLLWLSVSHLPEPATFVSAYRELYREAEAAGVAIAVGGQALRESLRAGLPYTTYGDGLSQLAAFARTLHPRPERPRRGRPPGS